MVNCIETLKQIGIVPVIQIERAEDAKPLGETLKKAGLLAAEITFRTEAAAEAVRIMASEVPELFVCAGTILTPEDAERAVAGGAKAIISPGTNPAVVRWCIEHDVPVIPGCATPSEVEWCMREGLKIVKLFPAEVVGLAHEWAGYAGTDAAGAVEALLVARTQARKDKRWDVADGIRDGLAGLGLAVEDTPQGPRVSRA